ncbi:MAG TPA: hypothetical protein VI451_18420 [Anaerolineales bacterium]|nr:hypothetical protein [Anaerolineales bacterium]
MRIKVLFLTLVLLLAACQPAAVATPVPPTATDSMPTPDPTATALPPSPTQTPTEISPTETPIPTPTATPLPKLFSFFGENPGKPVVPAGPSGNWDGKYINPGAMIYHDGMFHMFRNGFSGWPSNIRIGYMTSPDGVTWTALQEEPVMTSEDVPFAAPGADVSSVVVLEDGTWVLYFHTVNRADRAVIGRASAPSPLGPWTAYPEPVVTGGGGGAWDDGDVSWPHVVQTSEGFVMYYQAENRTQTEMAIGMATSLDGAAWTKYNDPDTNDTSFKVSDPVFVGEGEWDQGKVGRPVPVLTPDGWVMIYAGGDINKRGLATSQDGIHWTTHPANPVITRLNFPISGNTWDTALVYHDGAYYYFMEIGSQSKTNIYLTIHEGPLPESVR